MHSPEQAQSPRSLVDRYEQLRASLLGQCGSPRWGLNILHRQGLSAWCRALMACPDNPVQRLRRPDGGLPEAVDAGAPPGHREIVPIIARLIASSLLNEVSP